MEDIKIYVLLAVTIVSIIIAIALSSRGRNLDNIKSKEVGDGQHGADHFASDEEVRKYYQTVKLPDEICDRSGEIPQGRVINFNQKTKEVYVDTSDQHIMVEAPTESGKSTKYVIPNVQYNLMAGTTMIIPDTKKEIFNHTAADAQRLGYQVYILDFTDPLHSHTYDYLEDLNEFSEEYLKSNDFEAKARMESVAGKLAKSIVGARERSDTENSFFLGSSEGILHSLAILVSMFGSKAQRHLSSINNLLLEMMRIPKKPKENTPVILKLLEKLPENFGAVKYFGPGFAATGETEANIYASAIGDIKPFIDSLAEQIIALPDEDEHKFSCKKLLSQKSILYVCIPEDEEQFFIYGSTIMKNILNQLSKLSRNYPNGKLPKRIYVIWEEFGLYPKVDNLKKTLAIARGKGVLLDLIYQDQNQMIDIYGETIKKILSSQCGTSIYLAFGPEDIESAERISKSMGNKTVKTGSISVSHDNRSSGLFSSGTSHSKTEQMMERALMNPSEVMKINMKGITLVLKRDKNPYKSHLEPYYSDHWGLNKEVEKVNLGINRAPREPEYITLNELLHKISDFVNQEERGNSYIKITKVPASQRKSNNEYDIIKQKLFEITGDTAFEPLLLEKKYNAFFQYMEQYKNKITRFELQQLIAPLAEK